jgi:hypothetical protein
LYLENISYAPVCCVEASVNRSGIRAVKQKGPTPRCPNSDQSTESAFYTPTFSMGAATRMRAGGMILAVCLLLLSTGCAGRPVARGGHLVSPYAPTLHRKFLGSASFKLNFACVCRRRQKTLTRQWSLQEPTMPAQQQYPATPPQQHNSCQYHQDNQ